MSAVKQRDGRTVRLKQKEFAVYVGVSSAYVSRAVHNDWLCGGFRVSEWAVKHWKGNRYAGLDVPLRVAKEIIPREEWHKYDIQDA